MSKTNKFNFLRDRKTAAEPELEEVTETAEAAEAAEAIAQEPAPPPRPAKAAPAPQPEQPKKMGRPRGKRSDPNYEQVTAYIRRDTYTAVKIALLQEEQGREFSELVEDLLAEYLSTQKSKSLGT